MSDEKQKPAVVMPIGKYKGQPLEVLESDPLYKDWLLGQDWFREKFGNIHTVIINNFAEPSETPEHNAMQAMFLDEDWAIEWVHTKAFEEFIFKNKKIQFEALGYDVFISFECLHVERNKNKQTQFETGKQLILDKNRDTAIAFWEIFPDVGLPSLTYSYLQDIQDKRRPDESIEHAWDVLIKDVHKWKYRDNWETKHIGIELKPSIGDDYPAILRKMKSISGRQDRIEILAYHQFSARGISEENLIKLFKNEGITARRLG